MLREEAFSGLLEARSRLDANDEIGKYRFGETSERLLGEDMG
jgi:hypothetical protein